MAENRHKQSIDSITKTWALLAGVCVSPLFFLFAYFGDPGRGRAAFVIAGMIALAARFLWDLRTRVWFWITITIVALLHVPLILFIPWGSQPLTYVALLPGRSFRFCHYVRNHQAGRERDGEDPIGKSRRRTGLTLAGGLALGVPPPGQTHAWEREGSILAGWRIFCCDFDLLNIIANDGCRCRPSRVFLAS